MAAPGKFGPATPAVTPASPSMSACKSACFRPANSSTCWGRSTELGQDGIGATLTGDLETGEIVSLEFPLPLSPYPLKVRAIVRYRQGLRYGFEFLTLSDAQRDTVRRVCEILATRS